MMDRYIFIGNTANGLGYVGGQLYDLTIERPGFIRRMIMGWPAAWRVVVTGPVFCPYSSEAAFEANWQPYRDMRAVTEVLKGKSNG